MKYKYDQEAAESKDLKPIIYNKSERALTYVAVSSFEDHQIKHSNPICRSHPQNGPLLNHSMAYQVINIMTYHPKNADLSRPKVHFPIVDHM